MSTRIAVVCEDPTFDRFIAKPIIERVMSDLGRERADVTVVTDPRCTGINDLMAKACDYLERYGGMASAVVFVIDVDGEDGVDGRPDQVRRLRNAVDRCENHGEAAVVVGAVQEIEVWAIWGSRDELAETWEEVRAERDPKERFFEGLLTEEDHATPDGGRTRLVKKSLARGLGSLTEGCPELSGMAEEIRTQL